jgi:hypothetical protein
MSAAPMPARPLQPEATRRRTIYVSTGVALAGLGVLVVASACRTAAPVPPADLTAPGWTVRQGQAVWKRGHNAVELAGELTVATQPHGRAFVQFVKPPLPLITLQVTTNHWELQSANLARPLAAPGRPPQRLAWTQLLACLAGRTPPPEWVFEREGQDMWRLTNRRTGETVAGYLSP